MAAEEAQPGKMEGERLPVELYPSIISNLPRSDLPIAMRVSSTFYTIAARLLYTSLDVDLSKGVAPFQAAHSSVGGHHHVSQHLDPSQSLNPPVAGQPSVLASLPSRFSYTTHLTLATHSFKKCRTILPLTMPNLISLRIRPARDHDHLTVCHCARKSTVNPCRNPLTCHCPLIANLRPPQLILGNMQTGIVGSSFPPPSAKSFIPNFVEHLVVVVWALPQLMGDRSSFASIPSTVRRLTLIVQRWRKRGDKAVEDEEWETESEEDGPRPSASPTGMSASDTAILNSMWSREMGQALVGGAKIIEIVGYDTLWRGASAKEIEGYIEDVRRGTRTCLVGKCTEEEAGERAAGLRFMTGGEYIQKADGAAFSVVRDVVREIVVEGKFRR